jgi:hypothetical protein
MTVFWILGIAFAALGIYLYIYSQKRRRLVREFASSKGLSYSREDQGNLERDLEEAFSFDRPGITRNFGRIRDVVLYEGITMFRTTELLDLNPHGSSQNTHFGRIAVYFDAPVGSEMFFLVSPELEYSNRHPTEPIPNTAPFFIKIKDTLETSPPSHYLSVTSMRGEAILYLQPAFGSEKREDLEYLLELAGTLYRRLWSSDT